MKYGMIVATMLFTGAALAAGDGFAEGTLKPQCMARVSIPAKARQALNIRVTGSGGDLDCYLYHGKEPGQPFGKFVTRDDSDKDGCDLRVVPDRDETYLLLVHNVSEHDEHYAVMSH
jgi:hypothetical protein